MHQVDPQIIFEDQDLLVINKPANMTVNRADTTRDDRTLQDFVEEYLHLPKGQPKVTDTYDSAQVFASRAGIVHRLDKETSGLILVAKNVNSFARLQSQFKEKTVEKKYKALVHGKVLNLMGEINAPIGRLPWNRMRFGVIPDGREAVTMYKVLRIMNYAPAILQSSIPPAFRSDSKSKAGAELLTLLELYPQTGRTHQLRVHLKHIGHPIFGDFLYAGRKTARDDRLQVNRVFLHAFEISFSHPTTSERLSFTCDFPQDLQNFLNTLQEDKKV